MGIRVGFKKLEKDAVLPIREDDSDSGFDLVALEDTIIEPEQTIIVSTGIALELPEGYEAQIRPRSGVTSKTKLRVQLGTIDQGYKGELGIILDNIWKRTEDIDTKFRLVNGKSEPTTNKERTPKGTYLVKKGDRIAQLVIQQLPKVIISELNDLSTSKRGSKGFGSSGTGI